MSTLTFSNIQEMKLPDIKTLLTKVRHILLEYVALSVIVPMEERAMRKGIITPKDRIIHQWPIKMKIVWAANTLFQMFAVVALFATMYTATQIVREVNPELAISIESAMAPGPKTWLSGTPVASGSRESVIGAYNYAVESNYTFMASAKERDQLISNGTLVKLEGEYIKLINVSEPYLLPEAATFVNRLGLLYAEHGCGKLGITSALRNREIQETLKNGADLSVHPTGMAFDLRRTSPQTKEEQWCLNWLQETLLEIESRGRIDVTAENNPRHFHVVVATHDYSRWLALKPVKLDADTKWLATALFFEAGFNELDDGYRAIGWAIRNRVRSREFPNTITEVVAEGAAGRSSGGCQFSFMCDGKAEQIQTLCLKPSSVISQFWSEKCDARWAKVVIVAQQIIAEKGSDDPTGGAVLYYAASMKKAPYWSSSDMKKNTVKRLGNHVFACSVHRGNDACRI